MSGVGIRAKVIERMAIPTAVKVVQRILSAPVSIQWVRNMPQYKVSKASWTVDAFVKS